MSEEDDFLRAVACDRDDRATRLVFTDWLLERGDGRAEFVRLDTDLRSMSGDEPAFAEAESRWREWRGRLPRLWLAAFGHLFTTEELNREAARTEMVMPFAVDLPIVAFTRAVAKVSKLAGVDVTGYRAIANTGADGHQEVPHFHLHILGGQRIGRMISLPE